MKQGLITAVQRFSLNDGPGIRTTIFLKGCSLHCAWCHNPETIRMENELMVHPEKCIGCGHCVDVCPSGAHRRSAGELLFDRRRCIRCGKCAEVCLPGAIEMAGQWRSVDDIMEEVLQDQAYYTDSGGGVTLSGGEVFCQAEFANLLIDACRKEKLHTAVETNLFADFDRISPILEKLDRSFTLWEGRGGYSHDQVHVLCVCLSKYEVVSVQMALSEIDPHAFTIIQEAIRVGGNFGRHLSS